MAPPTSVLSQTLQSITVTKIRELEKQRSVYESRKREILGNAPARATEKHKRLSHLLAGVKELYPNWQNDKKLVNMERWLDQSQYDESFPNEMLHTFENQLLSKLDIQSRKLGLADLYSRLLTEWMNPSTTPGAKEASDVLDDSFEFVERQKERLQQLCDKFESVVFTPFATDEVEIHHYLQGLFVGDAGTDALEELQSEIQNQGEHMLNETAPFNETNIKGCLEGLLSEDLLSDEKQKILREFKQNEVVLKEIADVLNMRWRDIKNWDWQAGPDGIPVMPRQQLNGKYRIWMDEDVLQAIFIQYIGITWCVALKRILKSVRDMPSFWTWDFGQSMTCNEKDRRQYYLGETAHQNSDFGYTSNCLLFSEPANRGNTVESHRREAYRDIFFLSQLPSQIGGHEAGNYEDDENSKGEKKPSNVKQQLLRQLATDVLLRQTLDGEVAIIQSDLQWFATSLPHSTLFAIMRFVGFSEEWTSFFKKYLEAPLNLDPSSERNIGPRPRKRGVPMAHAPEKLLGELVLFFLDVAVMKESGMLLYRLHDDLWICGQPKKVAQAWRTMQDFARVMGLEYNKSKTGSVYLVQGNRKKDLDVNSTLPSGPVSVGFLTLDPNSGNWVINQEQVGAHITQLKKQLASCDSVLSWVQTWNSCIGRFFVNTFGEPANCFGRPHVDSILETHKRMQCIIFGNEDGKGSNVTNHLRRMIYSRFGISDIPDAFFFLPEQLGGLGLRNPFVSLLLVRDSLPQTPQEYFVTFLEDEKKSYALAKKEFDDLDESTRRLRFRKLYPDGYIAGGALQLNDLSEFMSIQEFTQWREATSHPLYHLYSNLMSVPVNRDVQLSEDVTHALYSLNADLPELSIPQLDSDKKWLIQLHSAALLEFCGGLSMVDKRYLPLGVLGMMRQKKVTWQMVL